MLFAGTASFCPPFRTLGQRQFPTLFFAFVKFPYKRGGTKGMQKIWKLRFKWSPNGRHNLTKIQKIKKNMPKIHVKFNALIRVHTVGTGLKCSEASSVQVTESPPIPRHGIWGRPWGRRLMRAHLALDIFPFGARAGFGVRDETPLHEHMPHV